MHEDVNIYNPKKTSFIFSASIPLFARFTIPYIRNFHLDYGVQVKMKLAQMSKISGDGTVSLNDGRNYNSHSEYIKGSWEWDFTVKPKYQMFQAFSYTLDFMGKATTISLVTLSEMVTQAEFAQGTQRKHPCGTARHQGTHPRKLQL